MANTYYVNPDADAGGDGTTPNLTGSTCAFKSIAIWAAARLTGTLSDIEECVCDTEGTADTTVCDMTGYTSAVDKYPYIHPDADNLPGIEWDSSKFRMSITPPGSTSYCLRIREEFCVIDGLQLEIGSTYDAHNGISSSYPGTGDVYILNCIIKYKGSGDNSCGIYHVGNNTELWIINNVIYNFVGTGNIGITLNSNPDFHVYYNTCWNNTYGINAGGGKVYAFNNLSYDHTTNYDFFGSTFDSSSDYNFSKDDSAPDAGNSICGDTDGKYPSFLDEGSGTEDLHIDSDSDAIGAATPDPESSGLCDDDGEGDTRDVSTPDIGADEYVVGGAAQTLYPTALASTAAIGSPQPNLWTHATGLASTAALGSPQANLDLPVTGLASGAAVGEPITMPEQFIDPDGVASVAAVGSPQVDLVLAMTGLGSGAAIGSPQVDLWLHLTGLASGAAYGSPNVVGAQTVRPTGLGSGAAIGEPVVISAQLLYPDGVASVAQVGTPQVNLILSATGLASVAAIGSPSMLLKIVAQAVASTAVVGTVQVNLYIAPTGLASGATVGEPLMVLLQTLLPDGVASGLGIGEPVVSQPQPQTLSPTGIASGAAFGSPGLIKWVSFLLSLEGEYVIVHSLDGEQLVTLNLDGDQILSHSLSGSSP